MSATSTINAIAKFEYPREVRFVDTDATGFAHFSVYVRMMEETEYAFLRSRGLSVVLNDDKGRIGFPRVRTELEIREPLVLDDELVVSLRLGELDGKVIQYHFEAIRVADGALVVVAQFTMACCRFPDAELPYAILVPEWIEEKLLKVD